MAATTPPVYRYVGRIIHVMRKERGMRQAELASLTGLKQPNLSRIENGLVIPRSSTLEKVAVALDVQVKDLLSETKAREVETKWSAVLSPKNAGQVFAGQLSAVPLFAAHSGYAIQFDALNQLQGPPDLTLQLPPVAGRAFATHVLDDSMRGDLGGDSFRPGEVLVFSDQPAVESGDYAFVHARGTNTFRQVLFESRNGLDQLRLVALNKAYAEQVIPKHEARGMWKLVRRIQEF